MTLKSRSIIKIRNLCKSYGGTEVLHSIEFDLLYGEIHVLIGENGAGKSTLMKIISGVEKPDSGEILFFGLDGKEIVTELKNPKAAQNYGISMVFQESNLIDNISIAENIYLAREPQKNGLIDWKKMYNDAREQLKKVESDLDPKQLVGGLSAAEKQRVEIAKALSFNAKIIIFDEPTSSLSDNEVEILFSLINNAKKNGISIVYITHRMNEIFEIGDRITVLRDGRLIDTVDVSKTNSNELVRMMIGQNLIQQTHNINSLPDNTKQVLSVRNVTIGESENSINFDVYKGEILGFFGLIGSGRTELAKIIFGIDKINEGVLKKNGVIIKNKNPEMAINNGFAFLPEDRKNTGLIFKMAMKDNLLLVKLRDLGKILYRKDRESEIVEEYIDKLSINTRGINQLVDHLSGGNQQKVVFAKWLAIKPEILILDEPTRGIDVRTKSEIYDLMRDLTNEGVTIIMISSDLQEVLRVSNRVAVMHDYKINLIEKRELLNEEIIMEAAVN